MSENKKDKKNKNLNEKEIEKISGGQLVDRKIFDKNRPHLLEYGRPMICKVDQIRFVKKKGEYNKIIFNKDEDINK